ncbi:MAG: hypothetical protein ABII23_00700 [bacterium]
MDKLYIVLKGGVVQSIKSDLQIEYVAILNFDEAEAKGEVERVALLYQQMEEDTTLKELL